MCAKHTAGPPHYARPHTVISDPLPRALAEREFMTVRSSQDVEKISKAWRVAGGTFYKVELRCSELSCGRSNPQRATPKADDVAPSARGRRQLVCDMQHAFSCKVWPSALPPELRLCTPLLSQSRHAPVRMYSCAFASAAYRTICSACESSGEGSSPVPMPVLLSGAAGMPPLLRAGDHRLLFYLHRRQLHAAQLRCAAQGARRGAACTLGKGRLGSDSCGQHRRAAQGGADGLWWLRKHC